MHLTKTTSRIRLARSGTVIHNQSTRILIISGFWQFVFIYTYRLTIWVQCIARIIGNSDLLRFLTYFLCFWNERLYSFLFLAVCDDSVMTYLEKSDFQTLKCSTIDRSVLSFCFWKQNPCQSFWLIFTVHRHDVLLLKIISKSPFVTNVIEEGHEPETVYFPCVISELHIYMYNNFTKAFSFTVKQVGRSWTFCGLWWPPFLNNFPLIQSFPLACFYTKNMYLKSSAGPLPVWIF